MRKRLIALACLAGCAAPSTHGRDFTENPPLLRTPAAPVLSVPPPDFVPFESLDSSSINSTLTNRVVIELPGSRVPLVASSQEVIKVSHVVVVGDSLTVESRSFLQLLAEKSGLTIQIDAVSGRKTSGGATALKKLEIPLGATIVVALGTNDSNNELTFRSFIDEFMAHVPSESPVVWLTSYRKKPLDNVALALREAQLSYPRLSVADWSVLLASHKDWIGSDNVHYSPAGYEAFANFIVQTATTATTG